MLNPGCIARFSIHRHFVATPTDHSESDARVKACYVIRHSLKNRKTSHISAYVAIHLLHSGFCQFVVDLPCNRCSAFESPVDKAASANNLDDFNYKCFLKNTNVFKWAHKWVYDVTQAKRELPCNLLDLHMLSFSFLPSLFQGPWTCQSNEKVYLSWLSYRQQFTEQLCLSW